MNLISFLKDFLFTSVQNTTKTQNIFLKQLPQPLLGSQKKKTTTRPTICSNLTSRTAIKFIFYNFKKHKTTNNIYKI